MNQNHAFQVGYFSLYLLIRDEQSCFVLWVQFLIATPNGKMESPTVRMRIELDLHEYL